MLKGADGESTGTGIAYEGFASAEWGEPDVSWVRHAGESLVSMPVGQAVGEILEFSGKRTEACRAWLFRYNAELTHFSNTNEWITEGAGSFVEDLQHTPVTMIAWLQQQFLEGCAVMVSDIHRMPRAAGALKAEFIRQGNRSVLSVPVFSKEGKLLACIGLDAVRRPIRWGVDIACNLAACGEMIALAWQRHEERYGLPEGGPLADSPAMVYLHQGAHIRGVPVSEIIGITAERDYTRVHLPSGVSALELRPLKVWLDLLPKVLFQRIHRGAIVNMGRVDSVERATGGRWRVHLSGIDEAWSVSKAYRADVRSRLGV